MTPKARASEGIRPSLQRFDHPVVHRVHWVHRVHVHRFKVPRRRKASAARACATEGLRDSGSPFLARQPPVTAALRPPSCPPGPLGPPGPRPPIRSPMTTEGARRASLCFGRHPRLRLPVLRQASARHCSASPTQLSTGSTGSTGSTSTDSKSHDDGRRPPREPVRRKACVTPEARSSQGSRPSLQRFAHPPVHRVHWVHRVLVHRPEVPRRRKASASPRPDNAPPARAISHLLVDSRWSPRCLGLSSNRVAVRRV